MTDPKPLSAKEREELRATLIQRMADPAWTWPAEAARWLRLLADHDRLAAELREARDNLTTANHCLTEAGTLHQDYDLQAFALRDRVAELEREVERLREGVCPECGNAHGERGCILATVRLVSEARTERDAALARAEAAETTLKRIAMALVLETNKELFARLSDGDRARVAAALKEG